MNCTIAGKKRRGRVKGCFKNSTKNSVFFGKARRPKAKAAFLACCWVSLQAGLQEAESGACEDWRKF